VNALDIESDSHKIGSKIAFTF